MIKLDMEEIKKKSNFYLLEGEEILKTVIGVELIDGRKNNKKVFFLTNKRAVFISYEIKNPSIFSNIPILNLAFVDECIYEKSMEFLLTSIRSIEKVKVGNKNNVIKMNLENERTVLLYTSKLKFAVLIQELQKVLTIEKENESKVRIIPK